MTCSPLARFVRWAADTTASDADLVRRFTDTRCDDAFAELVRRHGPTVYGVCRRAVGDHHLAEDAFQAVFVVLARRASAVRPPGAVGGWLFGVARKVAAEASMRKRRRRETTTASPPDCPQPAVEVDDTAAIVEAAIAELPDPLRAAVLACEIEGLSRKCAAARLGIAEGTLSSRLAAARKRLGDRLRPRVALTVAVPAVLAAAAVSRADGRAEGAILQLTHGVLRAMSTTKLRLVPLVAACVSMALLVGAVSASPPDAANERFRIKAPIPKAAPREGVVCVALTAIRKDAHLLLLKPDGEAVKTIELAGETAAFAPALNPDATRVAVFLPTPGNDKRAQAAVERGGWSHGRVGVYDLDRPDKPVAEVADVVSPVFAWAADGGTLYLSEIDPKVDDEPTEETTPYPWVVSAVDPATDKRTPLGLPAGHVVVGTSADGKTLVTARWTVSKTTGRTARAYTAPLATLKPEVVPGTTVRPHSMTSAGDRFVGFRQRPGADRSTPLDPFLVNVRTGKETALELGEDTEWVQDVRVSPDGKRVLVHRQVRLAANAPNPPGVPGAPAPPVQAAKRLKAEVAIRDTDGGNPKVVYEPKLGEHVTGVDWR